MALVGGLYDPALLRSPPHPVELPLLFLMRVQEEGKGELRVVLAVMGAAVVAVFGACVPLVVGCT